MLRQLLVRQKWGNIVTKTIFARYQSTSYSAEGGELIIEPREQAIWIKFNRPEKCNALLGQMYKDMTEIFTKVNKDDSVKTIVLTGNGEYYSSGNDLTNFTVAMGDPDGPQEGFHKMKNILIDFVDSLVCLEKFIIAAVNGPAVGIPVTTLPLCDYVIASDKATFQTPFTALGQCPEACSSLTFPQILGRTKSSELLLLNMVWDASRAQKNGLVSEVVCHDKFNQHLDRLVSTISKTCYPGAMKASKTLILGNQFKQQLLEANRRECDAIVKCWTGPECMDAVKKFLNRSKA